MIELFITLNRKIGYTGLSEHSFVACCCSHRLSNTHWSLGCFALQTWCYTWCMKTVLSVSSPVRCVSNRCVWRCVLRQCGLIFQRPPLSSCPIRKGSFWSSQERPEWYCPVCFFFLLSHPAELHSTVRELSWTRWSSDAAASPASGSTGSGRDFSLLLTENTLTDQLTVSTRFIFSPISPSLLEITQFERLCLVRIPF